MFSVTSDFEGGNVKVISSTDEKVILDVELRDTVGDWFFWCFKVTGAAGRTIEFEFANNDRVGYFGPAVSYDRRSWHWQYQEQSDNGKSFIYAFSEDENEVYFAHDMVYRPDRFFDFAKENDIPVKTLCVSEKGRDVPYIDTEKGDECILLTSRHHACESTGSYVLEGVLGEIIDKVSDRYRVICVPFVDYDGVVDGDQGKQRNNHDHNRDYIQDKAPVYNSTSKIREFADTLNIRFAFDFHSPWHWGGENDAVFIPVKNIDMQERITQFSRIFEAECNENSLPHYEHDNIPPDCGWNKSGTPCFGTYMGNKGAELSFTLETAYFKANDTMFTIDRAIETGKCFVKSVLKYMHHDTLMAE